MLPTGTVTFLFTDIEGSTRLWQEYPELMKSRLARHDELLRRIVEDNGGTVFKTMGDAFCAVFPTALQGIKAAVQGQQALAGENWQECIIKVRMGLHTGDAEVRDNDYFGTTLNRTARVMSAGHGGQILLSRSTLDVVNGSLPEIVSLRDLGAHRLKDLVNPETIYQLDVAGLPCEFPPLRTLDVQLNNLPSQLTHFVGREREIKAVLGLMRNHSVRLVTLTGAGGTGKTRLSLQVAAELLDEFEHGTWFVELASISDPDLFLPAVANVLKLKESAGKTMAEVLHEYLADKKLLLVLDNFEQLVSASPQISGLLGSGPGIKVLVTSRELLRIRGEHDYPVPPLGLPESRRKQTSAVLAQYEAIALFTQHAQALNPAFELDDDNANTIAEICQKLDGLPLAIELAAARSRMLKPAAMLENLKNKLDTLTGGARDLPHRQQTIRGAIDWSFDLLDEQEKTLFSRLGIFVGGWTMESAESVCGSDLDVMNGMESLLDKSLIRHSEGLSGETRFTMLETIRDYAFEKLTQSGELPGIQQRHADSMQHFLHKVAAAISKPEEATWFVRMDDELDNLRSVVEWGLEQKKPSLVLLVGQIYNYWFQRSRLHEPLTWIELALSMDGGTPAERATAMNCAGNLAFEMKLYHKAREFFESALAIRRKLGDPDGIASVLNNLANILWAQEKDFIGAQKLYEEVLELVKDPVSWGHSMALNNLGSIALILGRYDAALEYYTRSRQICVELGAEAGISFADWFLGRLALAMRKLDEALIHFENSRKGSWLKLNTLLFRWNMSYSGYIHLLSGKIEEGAKILSDAMEASLEYFLQNPNLYDSWILMESRARLEFLDGNYERSARLFGAAWTQRQRDDWPMTEFERPEYEERVSEVCAALGKAAFESAFSQGQAMDMKTALIFASNQEQI